MTSSLLFQLSFLLRPRLNLNAFCISELGNKFIHFVVKTELINSRVTLCKDVLPYPLSFTLYLQSSGLSLHHLQENGIPPIFAVEAFTITLTRGLYKMPLQVWSFKKAFSFNHSSLCSGLWQVEPGLQRMEMGRLTFVKLCILYTF